MKPKPGIKRVLIAHQSTIPHYRVAFYNAIERLRPDWWTFRVVFDPAQKNREKFFKEDFEISEFNFEVEPVRTFQLALGGKYIVYQNFLRRASKYDLLVLEHVVHNISYLLAFLYGFLGKHIVFMTHGRDWSQKRLGPVKTLIEKFKLGLAQRADCIMAYVSKTQKYLVNNGVSADKIFILNNTIDIKAEREVYQSLASQRDDLRRHYGLEEKHILLYVGRINARKRIEFLLEVIAELKRRDPRYHLIVVGGAEDHYIHLLRSAFEDDTLNYNGPVTNREQLARLYIMSDLYVFPGDVGLGPLQALCYDLTPVVIDGDTHGPEYEYLDESNALILPKATNHSEYAHAIHRLLANQVELTRYRSKAWPSIQHLTIENMAKQFIRSVNFAFGRIQ